MPRRSKISQLPEQIRKWLKDQLIARNFSGYETLTAEANEMLAASGYELRFSKSAAHNYGSQLERELSRIKASTEAARMIAEAAPDEADQRSAAVISMIQTQVFDMLVSLQEIADADPAKRAKLLSTLAKNMATLARASVNQKRWQVEVAARTQAAADRVAAMAKKGGLSASAIDSIKREILGIAQ